MGNMSSKNTINDPSYQGLKATDGAAHVRTSGAPGTIESVVFECIDASDSMTDTSAAASGEIHWASGLSGKTRIRFTYHAPLESTVPFAVAARVCVNPGDEATAITMLQFPAAGASATDVTSFGTSRMISPSAAVAEYDLSGTDAEVNSFAVGFVPPTGTGADKVYVTVEVW